MTVEEFRDLLNNVKIKKLHGMEQALLGYNPLTMQLIYSENKIIEMLMEKDAMSYEEATRFVEHQVWPICERDGIILCILP